MAELKKKTLSPYACMDAGSVTRLGEFIRETRLTSVSRGMDGLLPVEEYLVGHQDIVGESSASLVMMMAVECFLKQQLQQAREAQIRAVILK